MAAGTLPPFFKPQFFDYRGTQPLIAAGYQLATYVRSTPGSPLATYQNEALSVPNATTITLDGSGQCVMWLDTTKLYTFALMLPAAQGGAILYTWDVTPTQIPTGGNYLLLDGTLDMTGLFNLAGPATAGSQAVTLNQMNAALATLTSSVTAIAATATAAAAAATAAAAAITPTVYTFADAAGAAASMAIANLQTGTWQAILITTGEKDDGGATYSITVTQTASLSTLNVSNSFSLVRSGGSGYGRNNYGLSMAVGNISITTAGPYTLSMAAVNVGAGVSRGSMLILSKIA